MAAPSASEELEALELARARLEVALSGDENWRALRQSRAEGGGAVDDPARRARDTRLEMALADNALYQAWKHTNGAIDALHARRAAQSLATEPLVPAASTTDTYSALPDDVAALLRADKAPAPAVVTAAAVAAAASASPGAGSGRRLVDRLDRLEGPPKSEANLAAQAGTGEDRSPQGRVRRPQRQVDPVFADPPEATVTFVVRETRSPLLPSAEQSADLGTERKSALFDRLRDLDEVAPEQAGQTHSLADAADEEAEVTIVTVEQLKEMRAAEERAGIVRRFRKALSGD